MSRDYLTGEHFEYYTVCKTKLWLHHNRMIYANHNTDVKLGSILDENSFEDNDKVNLGHAVADFVEEKQDKIIVSEVKKSSKMKSAHKLQLMHYMWIIGSNSSKTVVGTIRYPSENKTISVSFNDNLDMYNSAKDNIWDILDGDIPKIEWKQACKNCSMREFCHS